MQLVLNSHSKEETLQIAQLLARLILPNDVVLLLGELGAGKTTFAQGIAKGLGIHESVKSPTFNIVKTYFSGRLPLFHIDAYRLEGQHQDIGISELQAGHGVCVVEWPQFLEINWGDSPLMITLERISSTKRKITILWNDKRIFALKNEVKL